MDDPLEPLFRALADPTRRQILVRLAHGPLPVHEVAAVFASTRPAVSRHLRVLRETGLVREQRRGRERVYALDAGPLAAVRGWLAEVTPQRSGARALAPRAAVARRPERPSGSGAAGGARPDGEAWDWAAWLRR